MKYHLGVYTDPVRCSKKIVKGPELGNKLIEALGLPENTIDFSLHVPLDGAVTIECRYYPSLSSHDIEQIVETFAEYELVNRDDISALALGGQEFTDEEQETLVGKARLTLAALGIDTTDMSDDEVKSMVIRVGRQISEIFKGIFPGTKEAEMRRSAYGPNDGDGGVGGAGRASGPDDAT